MTTAQDRGSGPARPGPAKPASRGRRAEIARAALELAAEVGPAAVTTGMIAARLGVSQPALYRHVRNKRDLWAGIGDEIAARIAANLDRAAAAAPAPVERIRRQVLDHLQLIADIPALPDIMLLRGDDADFAPLRAAILGAMRSFHARLVDEVAQAQDRGDFAADLDPEDAAGLLLGLIQNLILRMALSGRRGDPVRDGARMLELLLRAFGPGTARA